MALFFPFQLLSPRLHRISVTLVFALGFFGCAKSITHTSTPSKITNPPTQPEWLPGDDRLSEQVNVEYDEFKGATIYTGPRVILEEEPPSAINRAYLRALKHKSLSFTFFQIYLSDDYHSEDWRLYHSAWDSHGTKLDLTVIERNVRSCNGTFCIYQENIGIDITRQYLETHQNAGIRFKVGGKRGDQIFFFPSKQIKVFLSVFK